MAESANYIEMGDFLIEFNGCYLGCGKTSLALSLPGFAVRRDGQNPLQYRKLNSINWQIKITLASAERVWQMISADNRCAQEQFQSQLFTQGAVLKLYPVAANRSGYEFKKVYIESVNENSSGDISPAEAALLFVGEASADDTTYFTRMSAGARPQSAPLRSVPDIKLISQELMALFRQWLAPEEDEFLELNFFEDGSRSAYRLQLTACRDWKFSYPHNLVYSLTSRFSIAEKAMAEQKLFSAAVNLHGHTMQEFAPDAVICRVEDLQLGNIRSIAGRSVAENQLTFSVLAV